MASFAQGLQRLVHGEIKWVERVVVGDHAGRDREKEPNSRYGRLTEGRETTRSATDLSQARVFEGLGWDGLRLVLAFFGVQLFKVDSEDEATRWSKFFCKVKGRPRKVNMQAGVAVKAEPNWVKLEARMQ